jgi:hypothetical protein
MRCRAFDCRQLRGVLAGEISGEDALAKIREARERVALVNGLIDQIGGTNPNRGLAQRVANALTLPPGVERDARHDRLDSTMRELESFLTQEFRI